MKDVSKIFIALVTIGCCFVFCGCDGSGPSSSSSESSTSSGSSSNNLKRQVQQLTQERDSLKGQVEKLTTERDKLKEDVEILTQERDNASTKAEARYFTLSIIAYTALALGVIFIVGFFLLARNARKKVSVSTQDNLHCPRCGWEHRPEETVCKNCKTHF